MKRLILLLLCFVVADVVAQETNGAKKLFANSILNQKAPELIVEQWLTKKPDTKGKFVLIDFSSTWCHGCRKSMPELNDFQKEFANELVIIFITSETAEKVEAAKSMLIETPIAIDTKNRTSKLLEIKGIPHNVLIDPKGFVRWEGFPLSKDYELTHEVIANIIEKYNGTDGHENKMIKCIAEQKTDGKVNSLTEIDFAAGEKPDGVQKGNMQNKRISNYNKHGDLVEESFYNSGDTLLFRSVCKYDAKGNLSERLGFEKNGKFSSKSVFKYDSKGNRTEEDTYNSRDYREFRNTYKYDSANNLLEESLFDKDGILVFRSTYKYNKSGDITEKNTYGLNGELCSGYSAFYDKNGNRQEERIISSDGSVQTRFTRSFDDKGNIIVENVYDAGGTLSSRYTFLYDKEGKLQEESVRRPDGTLIIKYAYGYDSQGNMTEVSRYDPDGSLYLQSSVNQGSSEHELVWDYYNQGSLGTKYVNKYDKIDKKGNWLRRIKIVSQRPVTYTERLISYY